MLVWACTENGRKQNSQKGIICESGNNKIERQTKKQMARWGERGMEGAPENGKESSHSAHANGIE